MGAPNASSIFHMLLAWAVMDPGELGLGLGLPACLGKGQSLLVSRATPALVLADTIWSSSQAIKGFLLGNSTAMGEEEERGGTASSASLQSRSGTIPVTLLIPGAMSSFICFLSTSFYKLYFLKAARPTTKWCLSHVCENLGVTPAGPRMGPQVLILLLTQQARCVRLGEPCFLSGLPDLCWLAVACKNGTQSISNIQQ